MKLKLMKNKNNTSFKNNLSFPLMQIFMDEKIDPNFIN